MCVLTTEDFYSTGTSCRCTEIYQYTKKIKNKRYEEIKEWNLLQIA